MIIIAMQTLPVMETPAESTLRVIYYIFRFQLLNPY